MNDEQPSFEDEAFQYQAWQLPPSEVCPRWISTRVVSRFMSQTAWRGNLLLRREGILFWWPPKVST